MTVRKNFIFDEETAEHLKKIAEKEGKTQSQVVRELIEKEYAEISKEEKLAILDRLVGCMTDSPILKELGEDEQKVIQKVKAQMDV